MGVKEKVIDKGLELASDNNIQDKAASIMGMLFPYVGIEKCERVLVCANGKIFETTSHPQNKYPIGNVIFTTAGEALCRITEINEIDGYEKIVKDYLVNNHITICEDCSFDVEIIDDEIKVTKK